MQWAKWWVEGWGKPNLVHNAKEKMFENVWNDEMIGWIECYALEFELIQDFAHVWWELEDMYDVKKWMFMLTFWNVLLKAIYFSFWNLFKWKHACLH